MKTYSELLQSGALYNHPVVRKSYWLTETLSLLNINFIGM